MTKLPDLQGAWRFELERWNTWLREPEWEVCDSFNTWVSAKAAAEVYLSPVRIVCYLNG